MCSGCPQLPYKKSVSVHPVHGNPRTGLLRTFWKPHRVLSLVAQNTLRRNAAGWKRDFQYAIFALEFPGPLVSKRGFDPQYAGVFDRYAASTRSLLGMFRFSFNTKSGKDKKPIKIRPATQNTQRVEISIRNAMRRKRSGSGPLRFLETRSGVYVSRVPKISLRSKGIIKALLICSCGRSPARHCRRGWGMDCNKLGGIELDGDAMDYILEMLWGWGRAARKTISGGLTSPPLSRKQRRSGNLMHDRFSKGVAFMVDYFLIFWEPKKVLLKRVLSKTCQKSDL